MLARPTRQLPLLALATGAALLSAACGGRPPSAAPVADPGAARAGGPALVADQRSVPKVDVHAHYWKPHPQLVPTLERWNMRALLVNVSSDTALLEEKWRGMVELHAAHPDRFPLVTTFNPFRFNEPGFAENVIRRLKADIAQGARGVKVWKDIGLELKDEQGRHVQIDHPRFQPIWDFLVREGIPVLAHIAEPRAAWLPLDEDDPHYWYYKNHPQYHAYRHPEMPRYEAIIAARDRWLARNPRLVVIAAHLASLEHDVAEIARRLDAYPNLHVETAARINDLAMQPSEKVRDFMIRYQDRVLYGTDVGNGTVERLDGVFRQHWDYFAGADTVLMGNPNGWHRRTPGLALPRPVLEKLYHRNAERVLGLPAAAGAG